MINLARWTRIGRWFMALWVLFTFPAAVSILQSGHSAGAIALATGILAWGVVWIWFWIRVAGHSGLALTIGFAANVVLLTVYALYTPPPFGVGGVLVFVFVIAGACFPLRRAIWVIGGLSLLQIALEVIRLDGPTEAASSLVNSVLVGAVAVGARLFFESYQQLVVAREQLAHLAVTEERLRFARDLHDLLGQSLSVLVLKSELVSKQLPETADEALRGEVRDIAGVARKSLNDVREAVAGYRQATLQAEITSARSALRAAGIGFYVEDTSGSLPTEQDGVLAWCLREAVTNVLKHSGATKCDVRLLNLNGSAILDVRDNGRGAQSLDGGSGLAGMRERAGLVGGKLDVAVGVTGFHLAVTIPRPV